MTLRTTLIRIIPLTFALLLGQVGMAAALDGTWSGSGMANPKNGKPEPIRCRVTYKPESAKVVGLTATCATSSNKINQTGSLLEVSPSRYVGDFHNPQYDVSGRVTVSVSGGTQKVSFSSARGNGNVTLRKQ